MFRKGALTALLAMAPFACQAQFGIMPVPLEPTPEPNPIKTPAPTTVIEDDAIIQLDNCAEDCVSLPLMIVLNEDCDETCELDVMRRANIVKPNFTQTSLGIIFLNDFTDAQLDSLRSETDKISSIECNSCIVTGTFEPVCGSNNVTYNNEDEYDCSLSCHGADSSVTIAYQGSCGATQAVSPTGVGIFPIITPAPAGTTVATKPPKTSPPTFDNQDVDVAVFCNYSKPKEGDPCAFQGKCKYNAQSCPGENNRSNFVYDTCTCVDGSFVCKDAPDLVCNSGSLCPEIAPIPMSGSTCDTEDDLKCNYNAFICPMQQDGKWLLSCVCVDNEWSCLESDPICPRDEFGVMPVTPEPTVGTKPPKTPAPTIGSQAIELQNCSGDCLAMPLMVVFKDDCDEACEIDTLRTAGIVKPNYSQNAVGVTFLHDFTDSQLDILRGDTERISSIECNDCIVPGPQEPICTSTNVTFGNKEEFECSLSCHGADSSVTIAYEGACGATQGVSPVGIMPVTPEPTVGTKPPRTPAPTTTQTVTPPTEVGIYPIITPAPMETKPPKTPSPTTNNQGADVATFCNSSKPNQGDRCDFVGTCQYNPRSCRDETDPENIVFDICQCRGGMFICETPELLCDDQIQPSCPSEMPIPNDRCVVEDLTCNYNPFGCPTVSDETPDSLWIESCTCDGSQWLCAVYDSKCPDNNVVEGSSVPLQNCDADCMTMPLIVTFAEDCSESCATEVMKNAQISKESYNHLNALNIIFLNDVTDEQIANLRGNYERIRSIECNSCVVPDKIDYVCGTDGKLYNNEDEFNCGLLCRGADTSVSIANYGECLAKTEIIPLSGCDDDCMRMPLLITFSNTCDNDCAMQAMKDAKIKESKFEHLALTNSIKLNSVTDDQLDSLRLNKGIIDSIECDACVDTGEVSQVCGSNEVTYRNEAELECSLKCREADKTLRVEHQGPCSQSESLISLQCEKDCIRMPLLIGFQSNCDTACAFDMMTRANIPKRNFEHRPNNNIIQLNSVTDDQLMVLRSEHGDISFIECDSCALVSDDSPVCGTNGVTFKSSEDFECSLNCRDADNTLTIAHEGNCDSSRNPESSAIMKSTLLACISVVGAFLLISLK